MEHLQNGSVRRKSRSNVPNPLELGPGKRYPKLLLGLCVLTFIFMISWISSLSVKHKGPLAYVWPTNQTRDTSAYIHPSTISTIIQPKICNSSDPTSFPYLLIIVCSGLQNIDARTAIRGSWGLEANTMKNVKVVFLVGQGENRTYQEEIEQEARLHQDIIQEVFLDTYANLTIKSVMLLKWFNNTCDISAKLRTEYVLKTDDDMYINVRKLYELAQANRKPNLLVGSLICNAVPIKDPHNKWFVPTYMFKEKKFPNYLSGTGYLMQREVARKLYAASLETPLFHLEDIYLTGILSRSIGVRPEDHIGFSYSKRALKPCLFKQVISSHQVTPNQLMTMHVKLQDKRLDKCALLTKKQLRNYGPVKCVWPK
ncbi:beta-1,3-galactosyltransferase 1 isoform X2 [Eurytemora carolleeae]|uniref:beta-1,3-galactosyltransferase 1 isoform X2 n=1 Tax=Eurytemora carolleeae TaxID=1294199 RepID=UPI000C7897AB|nr:beta-1,3-galactosyltransferase 1 isoform X2 [Eurytemora carolleeae]XP_023321148.1 beta-1,3-galactosyltransferase 1 isoform X2 [Eurytemora carolleeae]|eukprot:XP_023321147.1 beta-1,3-galactosyltransferase 1-like isoform X2 [Eurytemora affinis]